MCIRDRFKSVGFNWKKCGSKRKELIKKQDIVMCYRYLVQIKSFQESGRNIFLDEGKDSVEF